MPLIVIGLRTVVKFLASFPAFLLLGFLLIALSVWRRHLRLAQAQLLFWAALTLFTATPACTQLLLWLLNTPPALSDPPRVGQAQAIVVLGGGYYQHQEMGHEPVAGQASLPRLRYALHLAEQTRLPVLASGTEAPSMANSAMQEYRQPVLWLESRSRDTRENARFSARKLAERKVNSIVLVTSAFHMQRAARCFRSQGLQVLPAPTDFALPADPDLHFWVPTATIFAINQLGWLELGGQLYYVLRPCTPNSSSKA